jgi:hypothetical protein
MTTNNPWESANDAQVPSQHYFGQLLLDMYFCALIKGQGKVQYDPVQHGSLKRFTAINLAVFVPNPNGQSFEIKRELIAESKEWAGVILPSIKAQGLTPMTINQKWVHLEMVKTGTYTKNGEVKDLTNPKILEVFNSEQEALAAAAVFFGRTEPEEQAFDHTAPATPGDLHPAGSNGNAPGNAAIEAFVNVLYGQAQGDLARLEALIKGAGMAWDSPEVQAAVAKKTAAVPF